MNNTSQHDKQQNKVVWQAIEHNMMTSKVKHGEHPNVTWKTTIGSIEPNTIEHINNRT